MPDRIYATYTPTKIPEIFHTAIHYERRDASGNLLDHTVIEAKPENYDRLSLADNIDALRKEAFRTDRGPSLFGTISAKIWSTADGSQDAPYEIIAEGDDLSENLARMKLFAHGVNRAGLAYRGHHQNSNGFASGALLAGNLPPATGVAYDPRGTAGELIEYFAPGLNQPLQPAIGSSAEPASGANPGYSRSQIPSLPNRDGGLTGIFSGKPTKPRSIQPSFFSSP